MMRYSLFVQSGDTKKSATNGMSGHVFTIGATRPEWGHSYEINDRRRGKLSGPTWSIERSYATTFRLHFIFENPKYLTMLPRNNTW